MSANVCFIKVWFSKFAYNIKKLHSILFVAESDENAFQSWKKNFSGHFIKILASLEFQNRAQKNTLFSTEKYSFSYFSLQTVQK